MFNSIPINDILNEIHRDIGFRRFWVTTDETIGKFGSTFNL